MISQIREQGEEAYGEIVPVGESVLHAYMITKENGLFVRKILGVYGGLLRFQTEEQAELFLENNRELVEEYLKTF